jgi:hypothetical protein
MAPMPPLQAKTTVVGRFNALLATYRRQAIAVIAVIAIITIIAAEVFPTVQNFLTARNVVAFVTLLILLDLAAIEYKQTTEDSGVRIIKNQDESLPYLGTQVKHCRHSTIDLLEYAASTTLPLIREIRREEVPLRILVKHPDTVVGLQRQRMIATLDTIYNSIFENYTGSLEIRCYRQPYSLRARRLGEHVMELGWLTPDIKRRMAYGHANPSMLVDLRQVENAHLRIFFQRTFDDLWGATDTQNGLDVLQAVEGES